MFNSCSEIYFVNYVVNWNNIFMNLNKSCYIQKCKLDYLVNNSAMILVLWKVGWTVKNVDNSLTEHHNSAECCNNTSLILSVHNMTCHLTNVPILDNKLSLY
jgi:hypothetical protein